MAALLEFTSDFIMLANECGEPVMFNRAYADLIEAALGVKMRPGLKPHTLLPDPQARAFWDDLHRRVLGGERFGVEVAQRWVHVLGRLELAEDGTVAGMIGTVRDVTEHKELEARLRQQEKLEAIGPLAGGVAHDFNNELMAILGFAGAIVSARPSHDPQLAGYGCRQARRPAIAQRSVLAEPPQQTALPLPLRAPG